MVVVPALIARTAGWWLDGDQRLGTVLWASALVATLTISIVGPKLLGPDIQGWIVGLAILVTSVAMSAGPGVRPDATGPAGAVGVFAATICLVHGGAPVATLLAGLGVFALAVVAPVVIRPRPERLVGFLAALVSPLMLVPMVIAWRGLTGDDWLGAVPLALGGLSAVALLIASQGGADGDDRHSTLARSVTWALTVTFATIALPMQLRAQWLTVAWAAEGAALLIVAARNRTAWLSYLALGLLATVTVRLVANPAVLDYHLVKHAHLLSWVWYGYGLPAAALAFSARIRWLPAGLDAHTTRRALEIAAITVGFCGLNLVVSHGFAGGDTLTFWDAPDAARALRTVLWAVYGTALLAAAGRRLRPRWRAIAGLVLLGGGAAKLAAWDLWVLDTLPSALSLAAVASCAFVAAGLLGRTAAGPSRRRPAAVEAP